MSLMKNKSVLRVALLIIALFALVFLNDKTSYAMVTVNTEEFVENEKLDYDTSLLYAVTDKNEVCILDYYGKEEVLEIPDFINNKPVIEIFSLCQENSNDVLEKVIINKNLSVIQSDAFRGFRNLEFQVDAENLYFRDFDGSLYNKDMTEILYAYGLGNENGSSFSYNKYIDLPDTVTTIGSYSFYASRIGSLNLSSDITRIEDHAFHYAHCSIKFLENNIEYIGDYAFSDADVSTFSIGKNVSYIGENAFSLSTYDITVDEDNPYYCLENNLLMSKDKKILYKGNSIDNAAIYIPDTIETIKNYAFKGSFPKEVYIPASVKNIEEKALITSARQYIVDDNNPNYASEQGTLMNKNKDKIIRFCKSSSGDKEGLAYIEDENNQITISDNVVSIAAYSFYGTSSPDKLILPSSITYIGEYAFANSSIDQITVDAEISEIPDYAFYDCATRNLRGKMDSVQKIGKHAFEKSDSLMLGTDFSNVTVFDDYAFSGCSGLTHGVDVSFNPDCSYIGCYAFSGVNFRNKIVIPEKITTIKKGAFLVSFGWSGDSEIVIHKNVEQIEYDAFAGRRAIKFTVEEGNENYYTDNGSLIDKNAKEFMYACSNEGIKECVVPEGIVSIGASAFYNNYTMEEITLPESLTIIKEFAFAQPLNTHCLNNINIPKNVEAIERYAFNYCSFNNLIFEAENVKGVFSMGSGNNLYIGKSVGLDDIKNILSVSFKNVEINPDNESIIFEDGVLFDSNKSDLIYYGEQLESEEYTIPDSVVEISATFYNTDYLKRLTIPDSVLKISKTFEAAKKEKDLVIYGYTGSIAEAVAKRCSLEFVSIGISNNPVETPCPTETPKVTAKPENTKRPTMTAVPTVKRTPRPRVTATPRPSDSWDDDSDDDTEDTDNVDVGKTVKKSKAKLTVVGKAKAGRKIIKVKTSAGRLTIKIRGQKIVRSVKTGKHKIKFKRSLKKKEKITLILIPKNKKKYFRNRRVVKVR